MKRIKPSYTYPVTTDRPVVTFLDKEVGLVVLTRSVGWTSPDRRAMEEIMAIEDTRACRIIENFLDD